MEKWGESGRGCQRVLIPKRTCDSILMVNTSRTHGAGRGLPYSSRVTGMNK